MLGRPPSSLTEESDRRRPRRFALRVVHLVEGDERLAVAALGQHVLDLELTDVSGGAPTDVEQRLAPVSTDDAVGGGELDLERFGWAWMPRVEDEPGLPLGSRQVADPNRVVRVVVRRDGPPRFLVASRNLHWSTTSVQGVAVRRPIHNARFFWLTWPRPGIRVSGVVQPLPPRTWEDYARQLGHNLLDRRRQLGLTQEQVAHLAGTTRNHYQLLERGYWKQGSPSNPKLSVVIRLARVLEADLPDLLPASDRLEW